jgi:hypothetical protein
MHRLFGTILICVAVAVALGSSAALAYDSPQQYGVELRGGFGMYDMGDVTPGIETLQANLNANRIANTLNEADNGPAAGLSFLYRPSRHTMWEAGFNAILDVENKVNTNPDTASGQILMHANEFFLKGNVVATLTDRVHLDFGAGVSYYNTELQLQDNYRGQYYYDAVGRGFGLIGTAGVEFLLTKRVGLIAQGGGRIVNTSHFTYYDDATALRTVLNVPGGTRPMEVNLSGAYANLGLRIYFDKVTKPVDFTR